MDRICAVCGRMKPENLSIMNVSICEDCEEGMIAVDMEDVLYDAFVKRLSGAMAGEG